ncbi:MAG: methyltransferase domain-containing protein [Bacteroidales bacterium]|nr:methyltransferase domain-containing protein [Bacteroidales bacterium]
MKNVLFGNEMERMPVFVFRIMKIFFKVYYFFKPVDHYISEFGIKPGDTIIDYGCGPGDYIRSVSRLVGEEGLVYAVDIHELAISSVEKLIRKYELKNVRTVLTDSVSVNIADNEADLIYAIDMFHMVKDTDSFLKGLCRITSANGFLIIEDGHQPRSLSKEKIEHSGCWEILEEHKRFLKCRPSVKST